MENVDLYNRFLLYDSVPVGIFIIDSNYRVIFWNACLEDWTGVLREEVLDRRITKYVPELDKELPGAQPAWRYLLGL